MTNTSLLCAAIRFAPIAVLFVVHCRGGSWPTDHECAASAQSYGFSVEGASAHPATLLTHLFIHFTTRHLLINALSLAATLVDFGDEAVPMRVAAVTGTDPGATSPYGRPLRTDQSFLYITADIMQERWRAAWRERSVVKACVRTAGAFTVWITGGSIGGLGLQVLYNNVMVRMVRARAEHAAAEFKELQCAPALPVCGLGDYVRSSLHRWRTLLLLRLCVWDCNSAVAIQEVMRTRMCMCGASSGICALAGFNAVYFGRPLIACCLMAPEMYHLTVDLMTAYASLVAAKVLGPDGEVEVKWPAVLSEWGLAGPFVSSGHAAHVGGCLMGVGIAYGWRWAQQRRLSSSLPLPAPHPRRHSPR